MADALAKFGLTLDVPVRVFDVIPSFISSALTADASAICFSRGF